MNKIHKHLGEPTLLTEKEAIEKAIGIDFEPSEYSGVIHYAKGPWIMVCKDGTYYLPIGNIEYVEADLSKLEIILNKWAKSEGY